MKKLMSIITMLLVVIGISGCGNSAPTKVSISADDGEVVKLEVGKDIAPGDYDLTADTGGEVVVAKLRETSPDFDNFDTGKISGSFIVGYDNKLDSVVETNNISLSDGDYLFICFAPEDKSNIDPDYRDSYIFDTANYNEVTLTRE